jgi:hypothetical protein
VERSLDVCGDDDGLQPDQSADAGQVRLKIDLWVKRAGKGASKIGFEVTNRPAFQNMKRR